MDDENEDGFIRFKVNDWDLQFERGNRQHKRRTKDQAIYGIWANSDSEDDDDDDGGGGKTIDGKKKKKHDYTLGVSFVKSDKKLQDEVKNNDGAKDKSNDLSKKPSNKSKTRSNPHSFMSTKDQAEFGNWEMYTKGVGSKLLQKMGYQPGKGLGKNLQGIIEPIEAKKRPGTGSIGLYGPESTTKKPRKGVEVDESEENQNDDDIAQQNDWKRNESQPTKTKIVKVYTKSTEDIIKESVEKSWNNQETDLTGVKIIDMTGPEQRVLTGLTKLHQSKPEKPKDEYVVTSMNDRFDIPELKRNIERLVLLSGKNLVKRKRQYDNDLIRVENLEEEKLRLENSLQQQHELLNQLNLFKDFIETIKESQQNLEHKFSLTRKESLSFEKALDLFENFFNENEERKIALKSFKIDDLILLVFNPILRQELRTWHPFDNFALDYSDLFERLKNLCTKSKTFDILLWDHWYIVVCRALQNWPSMKKFEPIIAFLEKWHKILPKWLFEHFIASNLLVKLKSEVEQWNPLTDSLPIHSWIHPWLPLILLSSDGQESNFLFEPIYEIIRQKLSTALIKWHPSDSSARLILEPWKNVFNESSMQTFLDKNIVPKLENVIQSFEINPNQQSVDQWHWVLSWKSLISLNTIVTILERFLFSKWLNVLYVWLNSGVGNFQEISRWYQGWKTLMGDELLKYDSIKDLFKKALIMMDHAVNLNTGMKSFASYYDPSAIGAATSVNDNNNSNPIRQLPPIVQNNSSLSSSSSSSADNSNQTMNFRQMVENKAAENGILFIPIHNRFEDGHQVFKFGQYITYIDSKVIFHLKFVKGKRLWQPILIDDLIEMAVNNKN